MREFDWERHDNGAYCRTREVNGLSNLSIWRNKCLPEESVYSPFSAQPVKKERWKERGRERGGGDRLVGV